MPKTTIRTVLNNVLICQDGTFTYEQQLVWSKWVITETNSKPQPFVEVIEEHLSDDLDTSDSTGQVERTSDQPTNKESI